MDEVDDLLRLVPEWRLAADEWHEVRDGLVRLRRALSDGDGAAAERAVIVLEELAPTRLGSMGDAEPDETQPPPPVVTELVVEIQTLGNTR